MSAHYNESLSTAPIVPVLTEKVADVPNPGYLTSLRQEIDTLHRRQQDDFEAFRAEMAAEFASIQAVTPAGLHEDDLVTTTEQLESSARLTSRRTLLKWGGVGAAAALAAAGGADAHDADSPRRR